MSRRGPGLPAAGNRLRPVGLGHGDGVPDLLGFVESLGVFWNFFSVGVQLLTQPLKAAVVEVGADIAEGAVEIFLGLRRKQKWDKMKQRQMNFY